MGPMGSSSDNLIHFQDFSSLSEVKVVKELEKRFKEGKFYTWVGLSLLAVNPGKVISELYSPKIKAYYQDIWKEDKPNEIPPHVFAVSSRAKYQMIQEIGKVSQAIVLTGESGSGKTHSTNHLVDFLVGCEGEALQGLKSTHCVWASVLLKAFGNAQTVCNSDSSRFGKLMLLNWQVEKHSTPQFVGAHLDAYLLEKTRVTDFPDGWNFHIFHQIISGLSEDDGVALHFPNSRKFRVAPWQNSDFHFRSYGETVKAANKLGISKSEWWSVLEILAAILHLGNVDFQNESEDVCTIMKNRGSLEGMKRGCHLLGMEEGLLIKLFTTKLIVANGCRVGRPRSGVEDAGGRGDTQTAEVTQGQIFDGLPPMRRPSIFRKQCSSPSECCARRDGILRYLYQNLFQWILKCINSKLSPDCGVNQFSGKHKIGLLDIFGFEMFEKNGLEQLCINYTNERLQRFYIQNDLMKSQEVLEEEGLIPLGTKYNLEDITKESLFDSSPSIFSILNDECKVTWRSVDESVADKLAGLKSKHLYVSPIEKTEFVIRHYAGKVKYSTSGMVSKNLDKVPDELVEFLDVSSNDFLKALLHQGQQRKQVGRATHLTKFVDSLNELMRRLDDMDVHYVHCLKPHPGMKTGIFDLRYFLQQLKYAGVMESIDIHKKAFPIRMKFDEFVERYYILASANQNMCMDPLLASSNEAHCSINENDQCSQESEEIEKNDLKFKCEEIIQNVFKDQRASVTWGRSSLFLSESNMVNLELKKERIYNDAASVIQKHWRKFKSSSVPDGKTSSCIPTQSSLGGLSVSLSEAELSGSTMDFTSNNLMRRRWNAYSEQYMRNSWKTVEHMSNVSCGLSEDSALYDPKCNEKSCCSEKNWIKTYCPPGLFHVGFVAKNMMKCSSCRDKLGCRMNNKMKSQPISFIRSIHCSSGIISRQNIPEVPVRFHTKQTSIPFSHILPVALMPQGIPDALP
ncbi:unconventional myosin-XIX-like [Ischnura elegans]|uniref:unconventional myosin-XIX-like n=1 Tax=Ischnura elegans TaxID=197161 RepID=UPI001ED89165|nr:unconventional myosin-XIX-like [Ischnura elegans]